MKTHVLWLSGLLVASVACDPSVPAPQPEKPDPLGVPSAPTEKASRDAPSARLTRIDVYGAKGASAASSRVVLLFEGAPLFHQRRIDAEGPLPERIAIDLSDTVLDASVPVLQAIDRGGVQRVRLAGPKPPRVVVDLQTGAEGRVFYLTDPYRIVIDVESRASAHARERTPVIVLDPGHGGREPGAANDRYDLVEAKVALDLAKLARKRLAAIMPGAHVILTRETDSTLSLEARCALANSLEADVFVSIHLNAGVDDVTTGGVTTFILDTTNNRQALRLAARENGTRASEVTGIQALLAHYHRSLQSERSSQLASTIQRATLVHGRRALPSLADRGVKAAMFYVLVGATMPAVLVEASFLTYEPEARALTTRRYQRQLAFGIAAGIASFLQAR